MENIITNLKEGKLKSTDLQRTAKIRLRDINLELQLYKSYGETGSQQPNAIIDSHNFLEISINQGSTAKKFQAAVGDKIVLTRRKLRNEWRLSS